MIKKTALILPVISGALWGSAGIFIRILREAGFDSITVISSKTILAAILLFAGLLIFKRDYLKIKLKDLWLFVGSGIFGIFLLNVGYNAAVEKLTLSLAAVLLSLSPVFVMIFARIVFKEKITVKKIICTGFAVFGCVLVSGIMEGDSAGNMSFAGIILGTSAAVFYALYSIFSKIAMERGYSVFTIVLYSTLIISIVLIPFTDFGTIAGFAKTAPLTNWVFLVIYAIATIILPYMLYTIALKYVDAGKVAILGAGGEPSAAMIFGILIYSEIPSLLSVAGLVITIAALAFICLPDKNEL